MARSNRMLVQGEPAVYHVMSRTALEGFVLGDAEKDYLFEVIKHLCSVYFAEVMTYCIMGNHFHLVVRMHPEQRYSDMQIKERFIRYYGNARQLADGQIPSFRAKWSSLSELVKEIKQTFTRYYNKKHNRRGFFWGGRFKSVLVENGDTLVNLLAYVDLNPVRAGIVERPDDYRWCGIGRHAQTGNRDNFLSLDFGLYDSPKSRSERFNLYREFVYEAGDVETAKGKKISQEILEGERNKKFKPTLTDRLCSRTRYFTDSSIIGSREFVKSAWQKVKRATDNPHKVPVRVSGLPGVYSLRKLCESQ